jgi:hypothetical protein
MYIPFDKVSKYHSHVEHDTKISCIAYKGNVSFFELQCVMFWRNKSHEFYFH